MTDSNFFAPTELWFAENFSAPTTVQSRGWAAIAKGQHSLLVAPTGSGKTLAAFLAGIDRLGRLADDRSPGVRVLYISPLKALSNDIEKNLQAPLEVTVRATGDATLLADIGKLMERAEQKRGRFVALADRIARA